MDEASDVRKSALILLGDLSKVGCKAHVFTIRCNSNTSTCKIVTCFHTLGLPEMFATIFCRFAKDSSEAFGKYILCTSVISHFLVPDIISLM